MNTPAAGMKRRTVSKNVVSLELEEDIHKSSFLAKLFAILSNSQVSNIVRWCEDGERFQIIQGERFQNEVIPMYFKHRNLKSFIRQLNLHGFKKLRSKTKQCGLVQEVYRHHFFRRDQPELVAFIKRKISKPVEGDEKSEQIVCLIEKQKELQTKLSELMSCQPVPVVPAPPSLEETYNQDLLTLMNAVELFKQHRSADHLEVEQARIFNLTKDFIKRLALDKEKLSVSGEELTAPSENVESEPEEERYYLATESQSSQSKTEAWESPESGYESLQSPPKNHQIGEMSAFYLGAEADMEPRFDFRLGNPNESDWMMLEGPL